MSNRLFITLHSIIYAIFAIALFFLPNTLWPIYGLEVNDKYALFLSQHNSIFLGGIAAIGFLFRSLGEENEATYLFIKGLLITNLLGVAITLYACITGAFSGFGWSDPIFFTLISSICIWRIKQSK